MNNRNGILGIILAIVAALFGGRAIQRRRGGGTSGDLGGLIGGIGGQQPGAGSGDLGGLLGGLGGEQPSPGTGKLRDTEGKPVQDV